MAASLAAPLATAPLPTRLAPGAALAPSALPTPAIAARPALAPARALAPALARPDLASRLNVLFDGARPAMPGRPLPGAPASSFLPSPFSRRPPTPSEQELSRRAKPWRTRAQLARLPPRPESEGFSFQLIGDGEPGRFFFARWLFGVPGVFERQLRAAQARGSDFMLQLGDMVSRGLPRYYSAFLNMLERVGAPRAFLTVLGNHDRRRPHGISDARLYRSLFGSPNYFFDHGGLRFVVADTSAGRMTSAQLKWLDRVLDTPRTKIVFTHMPPVQLSPWTRGIGGFRIGARDFAEIAARRGVARVYVGHVHGLGALEHLGVRFVLSGGGGSPLYPGTVKRRLHHTLTVEVGPAGIRETVHTLDGPSFPLADIFALDHIQ